MKKDLQSYIKHNTGYESDKDYYTKEEIINRTEKNNDFKRAGFTFALSITKNLPKTHIDIGSGVGWLVRKMSPYFEKSIGIEPSHAAVKAAQNLTDDLRNVTFLEEDMVEAYKKLNITQPVFFTTGAVLSHIEDYYVIEFLKLLNDAPVGSVLFFSENYDTNMNWNMWHIRNQEWWQENLSNWQLLFCNIENDGYFSGIYGLKVEASQKLKNKKRNYFYKFSWEINFYLNIIKRICKKILRLIK
jgi:hypothetical protein